VAVTTMRPVGKAADPIRDPEVVKTLRMVQEGSDMVPALDIALMELAIVGLDQKRTGIERAGKKGAEAERKKVTKFARAATRVALSDPTKAELAKRLIEVSKERWIDIPTYERRDGTKVEAHRRRAPGEDDNSDKAKAEWADIARELEEAREYQRGRAPSNEREFLLDSLDAAIEGAYTSLERRGFIGAAQSFLSESSIGKGILAVGEFFARRTGQLQFAAMAIKEFGPVVGLQVANAYFRYGGYDVPLTRVGDRVKTEMGDTLPQVESQTKSRHWAIETLKKRLPGQDADRSGAKPPSEGFIIDRHGNIIAHGVGRGNDHYLPFNSKHLRQLRKEDGVEYVRRRMFGGPTVEDFHAAMMMGADRLTVVSNGGTFTIDLTKRSHGIKMEHMQVLSRFQELLDEKGNNGLNIFAYRDSLAALQSEFPLHIRVRDFEAGKGDWVNKHDRIQPRARLVEALRNALSGMSGEPVVSPQSQKQWWSGLDIEMKGNTPKLPGQGNKSARERYQELINQGMPRSAALDLYERFMRATNPNQNPASSTWVQTERERVRRERQQSSTPSGSTQTSQPPRRTGLSSNVPVPRSGGVGEVTVTQDPTRATAQSSQPKTSMPRISPRARDNFEAYGFDPTRVKAADFPRLQSLAAIANDSERWRTFVNSQDQLELDEFFGNR
jgi:hypothetical protein